MWRLKALCRNHPASTFYPTIPDSHVEGGEHMDDGTIWEKYGDTSSFYDEARSICAVCPVRDACLDHALREKERWGMWGGLTPIERRRIERKDRRKRLTEKRAAIK